MEYEKDNRDYMYEIPTHTGINSFYHQRIRVNDIFPDKFYDITNSYIRKLQGIFSRYDAVIFMARKAICFYKALIINNELSPDSCCEIYSSRILSYNIWDKLKNKRIALIDDVVIYGASLAQAQNILLSHNIDVDIYIVAWMKQFDTDNTTSDLLANIQEPFVHLDEIDIYSYTNYITRYIEASMIPYNIDQPIVLTEYTDHSLETFTRDHRLTDITSSVQKKFHIQNRVIHYSGAILKPVLGSVQIDLNDVYVKIRIFHDIESKELLFFPIILFPAVTTETINHIYNHIQTPALDSLVWNENPAIINENKTNILVYVLTHYILSRFLWCERIHGRDFHYIGIDSNEKTLFAQTILCRNFINNVLSDKLAKLVMPYKWEQRSPIRPLFFNEYLGAAYVMIFSGINCDEYDGNPQIFFDSSGNEIKKKIITLQCLGEKLKKYDFSKQDYSLENSSFSTEHGIDTCIVSNIIDVLIDRGILIPIIVHTANNGIIRAYRCGEVAKLSTKEFELFCYMLNQYCDLKWENNEIVKSDDPNRYCISKLETEQLYVIFFRKASKATLFEIKLDASDEDDYYSLYYSLYGPTISKATGKKYEINRNETLTEALCAYGYIEEENSKTFRLVTTSFPNLTEGKSKKTSWTNFADIFAQEMLLLKSYFPSNKERDSFLHDPAINGKSVSPDIQLKKSVLSRIRNFEQLLTMMAIGKNEMQRTLSIIAEIKIIADMKTDEIQTSMLYFKNHMACIREGIWKSRCYVNYDLLENVQDMLKLNKVSRDQLEISRLFQDYVDGAVVDKNDIIGEFLKECGKFFYKTYYTILIINKYASSPIDLEANCPIPKRIKYERHYKSLYNNIKDKYQEKNRNERAEIAIFDIRELQREAMALLDICDLYLVNSAFGYRFYSNLIIVCADESDILNELNLYSDDCKFNQSGTGAIENDRFFRCFLPDLDSESGIDEISDNVLFNLEILAYSTKSIDRQKFKEANVTLIYYQAKNWFESLFVSGDTSNGKFIEKIVRDIFSLEKKTERRSNIELYVCGLEDNIYENLKSQLFKCIDKRRRSVIQNNYPVENYGIKPTFTYIASQEATVYINTLNGALVNHAHAGSEITGNRKE